MNNAQAAVYARNNEACEETAGLSGYLLAWPVGLLIAILILRFSPLRRWSLGNGGWGGKVLFVVASLLVLLILPVFAGMFGAIMGNVAADDRGWCGILHS